MGLRTLNLKLHNPSKIKRSIIDTALINYNNAFNYLLQKAHTDIERIESEYKTQKGNYSAIGISKWVNKELSDNINSFDVQPFKDSIKLDFGMLLSSWFAQRKNNPYIPFPGFNSEEETTNSKLRPIYFCRYDTRRSFCLLYDRDNNKFFAKIYIMNCKNGKIRENNSTSRELFYIAEKQEIAKSLKKETFIIVPLSFGKWQENMLQKAIENPQILRTARLLKKNNCYFLSLCIDLPEAKCVGVNSYMGISRGIDKAINYTVIDLQGAIKENGVVDTDKIKNNPNTKHDIFILANKIVNIALKNKSHVILQNLIGKGDKLSWYGQDNTIKPIFGCKLYNELARILEYKLPEKGLPVPARVSSVDIFSRCCLCGSNSKKNRFSKDMFICTSCGVSYKLDTLGSINLARKLINYENSKLKIKARRTYEGMYLQNELIGLDLFIAKNDDLYDKIKEELNAILINVNDNINVSKLETKEVNNIIEKLIKHDFANIEII